MDIRCPKCFEPWDFETLHEQVEERWPDQPWKVDGVDDQTRYSKYLSKVKEDFQTRGCVALGGSQKWCDEAAQNEENSIRGEMAAIAYELNGDDLDGAASLLEDAEYLGLI